MRPKKNSFTLGIGDVTLNVQFKRKRKRKTKKNFTRLIRTNNQMNRNLSPLIFIKASQVHLNKHTHGTKVNKKKSMNIAKQWSSWPKWFSLSITVQCALGGCWELLVEPTQKTHRDQCSNMTFWPKKKDKEDGTTSKRQHTSQPLQVVCVGMQRTIAGSKHEHLYLNHWCSCELFQWVLGHGFPNLKDMKWIKCVPTLV